MRDAAPHLVACDGSIPRLWLWSHRRPPQGVRFGSATALAAQGRAAVGAGIGTGRSLVAGAVGCATALVVSAVTMKIVPLGGGQDVGRSCVLVTLGGRTVMFDCGMHMGFTCVGVAGCGASCRASVLCCAVLCCAVLCCAVLCWGGSRGACMSAAMRGGSQISARRGTWTRCASRTSTWTTSGRCPCSRRWPGAPPRGGECMLYYVFYCRRPRGAADVVCARVCACVRACERVPGLAGIPGPS